MGLLSKFKVFARARVNFCPLQKVRFVPQRQLTLQQDIFQCLYQGGAKHHGFHQYKSTAKLHKHLLRFQRKANRQQNNKVT